MVTNENKLKLNLGCGHQHLKGYVNCDNSKLVHPDKFVDLEKNLPFEDNSVDEIRLDGVLEHINNFTQLMLELNRICKSGAKIFILVPFFSFYGQYSDPTHVRFFTPYTFDYFNESNQYSHEVTNKSLFRVEKVKIIFAANKLRFLNFIFNPLINLSHRLYCRLFCWILPAQWIYFQLKVIK